MRRSKRISSTTEASWDSRLVFLLLGTLLLLAPVVRGGNREVALSVLLAIGLALLAVLAAQVLGRWSVGMLGRRAAGGYVQPSAVAQPAWWWCAVLVVATSPLWLGLLQLVPVPIEWWASLPGRDVYPQAVQAAGLELPERLPISLNPQASWSAFWSSVPLVAAFLVALWLPRGHIDKLMTALLFAGLFQVLLSVSQFASGRQSPLYFGLAAQGFVGSFANRNHLADFLAMLVPVWFYAWLRMQREAEGHGLRSRAVRRPMWLMLGFSFLVVILSTQSRGGILATAMVLLLSALLMGYVVKQKLARWQRWGLAGLFLVFVGLAVALIDVQGLMNRIQSGRLQTDAEVRQAFTLATWEAARTFWPWGSGMGSFESVFPRFQPTLTPGYVNHAHNDYPQLLMEMGAPALLLVGLLLILALRQVWLLTKAFRANKRFSSELGMRCFAGLGALALLLHSWVEFNMHIPALAITAGFLVGVFLRPVPRD